MFFCKLFVVVSVVDIVLDVVVLLLVVIWWIFFSNLRRIVRAVFAVWLVWFVFVLDVIVVVLLGEKFFNVIVLKLLFMCCVLVLFDVLVMLVCKWLSICLATDVVVVGCWLTLNGKLLILLSVMDFVSLLVLFFVRGMIYLFKLRILSGCFMSIFRFMCWSVFLFYVVLLVILALSFDLRENLCLEYDVFMNWVSVYLLLVVIVCV